MKKITVFAGMVALLAITLGWGTAIQAHAQLFPYTGTSTAPSSTIIDASATAASTSSLNNTMTTATTSVATATIVTTTAPASEATSTASSSMTAPTPTATATPAIPNPVPVFVVGTPTTSTVIPVSGWIQINGLVVNDVSVIGGTWQILASNQAEMGAQGMAAIPDGAWGTCESFATPSATLGTEVPCPAQPVITENLTAPATTTASPAPLYAPYQVSIGTAIQLLFSDRTPAAIADITPGDLINVFGFYQADGSIEATVVRDLSKPVGPTYQAPALSTTTLESLVASLQNIVSQFATAIATATGSPTAISSASEPMIPYGGTPASSYPLNTSTVILGTSTIVNGTPLQILPSPDSGMSSTSASGTPSSTY